MKNVFDKWLRGGGSDGHSPTGPKRALGPKASDTYEKCMKPIKNPQEKSADQNQILWWWTPLTLFTPNPSLGSPDSRYPNCKPKRPNYGASLGPAPVL